MSPNQMIVRNNFFLALLPLVLLGCVLALLVWSPSTEIFQVAGTPPVEQLTFQRVVLDDDGIVATVLNDGPDSVTIAQVQVDDAFWMFEASNGQVIGHLGRTALRIPYPWVEGEVHLLRVLTSTGATFEYVIPVAVETPKPSVRLFGVFALIGIYVGVLPVAIGLLWFPFLAQLSSRSMDFLLALTVGLLVFLFVDGSHDGLELATALPESFQGATLFIVAAAGAFLLLEAVSGWLRVRRYRSTTESSNSAWVLAVLIAIGIGLHNFAEGLAIGSAFALGEATFGILLIVGFTLHNTTEGLAIVAPLARAHVPVRVIRLIQLGLIGGLPTITGAWLGGFVYSPVWSVFFLACGVGAIGQVVTQVTRQIVGTKSVVGELASVPVLGGLETGCAVMYVTGMIVGG